MGQQDKYRKEAEEARKKDRTGKYGVCAKQKKKEVLKRERANEEKVGNRGGEASKREKIMQRGTKKNQRNLENEKE